MRVVLIFNPTSGASPLAGGEHHTPEENEQTIINALKTHDIEPEVRYTTPNDAGTGLARQAAEEGVDVVIAAGGDGTIHAVATGLIGTESTLGIIAMGTMNNLAHSLSLPETIEEACTVIAKGQTRRVDIGKINGQVFLEVAGVGLEATLFPLAEEIKSPGLRNTLHGTIQGFITLFTYKPSKIHLKFDTGSNRTYDAIQVTICNAPYYGAHMKVAPDATMDDGLLDVVIYKNFSKWEYIRHAISISQGRREFQPKIAYRRAKTLKITSTDPLDIQADGLPHGQTPADVEIVPGTLSIRVPEQEEPGKKSQTSKLKDIRVPVK